MTERGRSCRWRSGSPGLVVRRAGRRLADGAAEGRVGARRRRAGAVDSLVAAGAHGADVGAAVEDRAGLRLWVEQQAGGRAVAGDSGHGDALARAVCGPPTELPGRRQPSRHGWACAIFPACRDPCAPAATSESTAPARRRRAPTRPSAAPSASRRPARRTTSPGEPLRHPT
jgi:hypothetical protein